MNTLLFNDLNKTYKNITFVSMCFNMGMKNLSTVKNHTRKDYVEYYVKSLEKLCHKFSNFIIFCDQECADNLNLIDTKNIYIVVKKFEELKKYKNQEKYTEIFSRMINYAQKKGKDSPILHNAKPEDIAKYSALNQSKIDLMYEASQIDPFHAENFYWIDAGCCQENYISFWKNWDGEISCRTNKFKCCLHINNLNYESIQKFKLKKLMYCWSEEQMPACMFSCHKNFIKTFYNEYNKTINELIRKDYMSSEQGIITYMIKKKLSLFDLVKSFHYDKIMQKVANEKAVNLSAENIKDWIDCNTFLKIAKSKIQKIIDVIRGKI